MIPEQIVGAAINGTDSTILASSTVDLCPSMTERRVF
jgi:hypothetical protein